MARLRDRESGPELEWLRAFPAELRCDRVVVEDFVGLEEWSPSAAVLDAGGLDGWRRREARDRYRAAVLAWGERHGVTRYELVVANLFPSYYPPPFRRDVPQTRGHAD